MYSSFPHLQLYERSLGLTSFKSVEGSNVFDLDAEVGSTFALTSTANVIIIDPFEEYVNGLKRCFDFEAIKVFAKRPGFSILFDGMHGAGGPFAQRVLMEELGFPEVCHQKNIDICLVLECACVHRKNTGPHPQTDLLLLFVPCNTSPP